MTTIGRVMMKIIFQFLTISFIMSPVCLFAEQTVTAVKVSTPPAIDGKGDDAVWEMATTLRTRDVVAGIDVDIQCLYTETAIFFLIRYPDPDESRQHKPWVWDKAQGRYQMGPQREDCFVLKWAMEEGTADLSVHADAAYTADTWFWKACRTDPAGYADDKMQMLGYRKVKKAQPILSKGGQSAYLQRPGDKGVSAYRSVLKLEYQGDRIGQFEKQTPTLSRADIRAKGSWQDGRWTIEFTRLLDTGNRDDVRFDLEKKYLFGVSRFEIAGRKPDPKLTQPLYGSGDVSESLYLVFSKGGGS